MQLAASMINTYKISEAKMDHERGVTLHRGGTTTGYLPSLCRHYSSPEEWRGGKPMRRTPLSWRVQVKARRHYRRHTNESLRPILGEHIHPEWKREMTTGLMSILHANPKVTIKCKLRVMSILPRGVNVHHLRRCSAKLETFSPVILFKRTIMKDKPSKLTIVVAWVAVQKRIACTVIDFILLYTNIT